MYLLYVLLLSENLSPPSVQVGSSAGSVGSIEQKSQGSRTPQTDQMRGLDRLYFQELVDAYRDAVVARVRLGTELETAKNAYKNALQNTELHALFEEDDSDLTQSEDDDITTFSNASHRVTRLLGKEKAERRLKQAQEDLQGAEKVEEEACEAIVQVLAEVRCPRESNLSTPQTDQIRKLVQSYGDSASLTEICNEKLRLAVDTEVERARVVALVAPLYLCNDVSEVEELPRAETCRMDLEEAAQRWCLAKAAEREARAALEAQSNRDIILDSGVSS